MWAILTSELLAFAGSWGRSRYPLGTTVAMVVVGLLVVLLIRRLTIGDWFGWRRTYVIRVILGFCLLLGFLMNPPRVVGIAILAVVTVFLVLHPLALQKGHMTAGARREVVGWANVWRREEPWR